METARQLPGFRKIYAAQMNGYPIDVHTKK